MTKKSRVFIDVSVLFEYSGNLTGISRTIFNVCTNIIFNHSDQVDVQFIRFFRDRAGLSILSRDEFISLVRRIQPELSEGINLKLDRIAPAKGFERGDIVLVLGEQWLYPDCMLELEKLKASGVRIASYVHDVIPFITQKYYWDGFAETFQKTILQTLSSSDFLFFNSRCTQADTARVAAAQGLKLTDRQSLIRLGDHFFSHEAVASESALPQESFLLTVGTVQPRKNHMLLIYVWKMLIRQLGQKAPQLVILGNRGWQVEDLFYYCANDPQLKSKISFKTDATDQELFSYYRASQFTLFPSFYEGWGLPVAEAVSLGKFCISSSASSMPEIAGDLIDYHDPYDSGDLYRKILHYLQNPAALEEKERRIQAEYRPTSWATFTKELVNNLNLSKRD